MTEPSDRAVEVHADLVLEIDGRPVTISADGREMHVQVNDVGGVLDRLGSVPRPVGAPRLVTRAGLRRIADDGARHGLTLTVTGPNGVLFSAGRGATSGRLTRVLSGTDHLSLGTRHALGPVLRPGVALLARGLELRRFRPSRFRR